MIQALLLLLAVSFGRRISRAEELPVKIGGGSGEEVELVGVSGGILTVETRQPGEQMFVRQMSNGQDLLILIYTSNGQLAVCEKFEGPTPELNRFLNQHLNLTSVVQQSQNGTTFKDTEKVEFNQPPMDWIRSWKECSRLQEAEKEQIIGIRRNPTRTRRSNSWTVVIPGTNWCGKGQKNGNSLYGYFTETDRCCHRHDQCPGSIGPRERKYNYFNFRLTTMSRCNCDLEFRRCLKNVGKNGDKMPDRIASGVIGRLYFTLLKFKCFLPDPVCVEIRRPNSWSNHYTCSRYIDGTAQIHEQAPY